LIEFAALEDRVLLNAAPVGVAVDGGAAAPVEAGGNWLVVEDYSGATTDVHNPQSGGWGIVNGQYVATPGSDAVSTLKLGGPLGENVELEVSINANHPSGPNLSNAFVIFDYQSATDFKFAGAYQGVDQWVIGHRTAADWVTDAYVVAPIHALTDYHVSLEVVGNSQVTLHVGGAPVVTHTFADSVTDGQIGVGTKSAIARFDDLRLRVLPSGTAGSPGELPLFEDFDDAAADHFSPAVGNWHLVDGHYQVTPAIGQTGASVLLLSGEVPEDVEVGVTFEADPIVPDRFTNGVIIFDYHSETDFKYAGGFLNRDVWVIGHRTTGGWIDDVFVSATLEPLTEYNMRIVIEDGSTVTLFSDDTILASHSYGDSLIDGAIGLGSNNSVTRFDNFGVADLSPPVSSIFAEIIDKDLVVSGFALDEIVVVAQSSQAFHIFDGDDLLYEFTEVKGNLRFDLGDADDHVTLDLNGHKFLRSVFAGLGEGDNHFEVAGGAIAKSLHVLAGGGQDDVVLADHVTLGKNADVDLGGGANLFSASGSKFGGRLKVAGGADHDAVTLEDVKIHGNFQAALGDGENELSALAAKVGGHFKVVGGAGADHVALENLSICGSVVARLGDGDNDLGIAASKVGGDLKVTAGVGADGVSIAQGVKIGHAARLSTSAGDDAIDFSGKAGWGLFVQAGDGADSLLVSGSVCGYSYVHMGAGDDRVEVANGGSLGRYAEVKLGAGNDYFSGPGGKHCWIVSGGRGDDTIEWLGKSKSHRVFA
jgi:hypothetical protein